MRRNSTGVRKAEELFGGQPHPTLREDPERAIALLEPLVTEERKARLKQVIDARLGSVCVLMDAPHDPHNGAAIVRSCEAFGVERLHVVERKEWFAVSTTVTRGAERWIDVRRHRSSSEAVATLREERFTLVATHPQGELEPFDLQKVERLALVLGNERDGIAQDLAAACSLSVRVPMRGFVESINVSVCAAILLSAATAHRPGDLPPEERRRLYARGLFLTTPRAAEVLLGR